MDNIDYIATTEHGLQIGHLRKGDQCFCFKGKELDEFKWEGTEAQMKKLKNNEIIIQSPAGDMTCVEAL